MRFIFLVNRLAGTRKEMAPSERQELFSFRTQAARTGAAAHPRVSLNLQVEGTGGRRVWDWSKDRREKEHYA